MGYRALLFCPDEKTARTVTQVLNELEFTVEASSEPFAAVKKLMGEHFDAVVVDCDNEQNATLLFKSARNSSFNQASLAVAVVEGQAGVAKAFRIGANLVLTKPINVEQAKGTLRVARGLLRKGEPAKSTNSGVTPLSSDPPSPPRQAPKQTATATPWGKQAGTPATIGTQSAAQDHASEISPPKPAATRTSDSAAAAPATSLQSPASRIPAAAVTNPTPSKPSAPLSTKSSTFGTGAASAPAPARIPQDLRTEEPVVPKAAHAVETRQESATAATANEASVVPAPVSTFTFGGANTQPNSEGAGNNKALIGVAAVAIVAAVLYFGWTKLHGPINPETGSPKPTVPAPVATSQQSSANNVQSAPPSAQTSLSSSLSTPSSPAVGQHDSPPIQRANQASANTGTGQNENAPDNANDPTASRVNKVSAGPSTGIAKSSAQPIVLRNGKNTVSPKAAAADTAAPSMTVASASPAEPLPSLISSSANSTTPVLQTLNVSQGVSQGLLVKRVQPNYPTSALRLHMEGSVQIMATIAKSGNITSVKALSGEPLLAQAAMDAVKQWKYKPYLLNGEPVEIQTQVTVNFKLPR